MRPDVDFLFHDTDRRNQDVLSVGPQTVPLVFTRNLRARRYILRVKSDGKAWVTIPWGGSEQGALEFVRKQSSWILQQLLTVQSQDSRRRGWRLGSEILYRGELVRLEGIENGVRGSIRFADQSFPVDSLAGDLRPAVEQHLRGLAMHELEARTWALATLHRLPVRQIRVRDQRTRWGSCSAKGTISLNWRLIQTPPWVRDYLILHELMHLR
ncbi:MAG: M48 family metallopeptidase, partial [Candidatus Omnitrophica bacterium]|nr:M48 family metallopeptidase [Candidatus Omnitrophota bacterium]